MGRGDATTSAARRSQESTQANRYAGSSANYLLRHLLGIALTIRRNVGHEIQARGHDLTPATAQLVLNLPVDGIGMSELAERLRLTLQRTGQLVGSLEEFGYVERVTDERDGRAKRVVYTRRGRKLLEDIDAADAAVTREIAAHLGTRRLASLCRDLEALDAAFRGEDDVLAL
jgi:DNA-binding MarR family transcriptional regulator